MTEPTTPPDARKGPDATLAAAALWRELGMPEEALSHLSLTGTDPVLPSSFAVGSLASASIGLSGLAAASLWALRTNAWQDVRVDLRHAAAEFRSERYLRIADQQPPDVWDRIAGAYRCRDGRWIRLHTNFPHHRDGVLRILGCAYDRTAVQAALTKWRAEAFESAASGAGMVVAAMRTFGEWDAHPHARALRELPVLTLERIGDAPPEPLPALPQSHPRPLSSVRALDLTRIIAGPVGARTLAAHGADVLGITAPHLPSIEALVVDTGRGKRAASLDLRHPGEFRVMQALLSGADVVLQGYRPGGLAALGVGPEDAARLRPGIVYVSLSAYGHVGPWAEKRGFDSLMQTASGFNDAEAEAAGSASPKPLPAQALDHASGYLMALGAMVGLHRRALQGGSWLVRVSLAQTGHWLRTFERVPHGLKCKDPALADVEDLLERSPSGFGPLTAVRHAAQLSETPARWELPSVPLGTHTPEWLPR